MGSKHWLAPSAGHRWVSCAGSPRAVASLPPDEKEPPGKDQIWGDCCHEMLRRSLTEGRSPQSFIGESIVWPDYHKHGLTLAQGTHVITHEDAANVGHAYEYVQQRRIEYGGPVYVEEKVDCGANFHVFDGDGNLTPAPLQTCVGRADVILSGAGYIEVVDYKNGVQWVNHNGNYQLLLYLIGALALFTREQANHQRVRLTLVQPRALRPGAPEVRTWEFDIRELHEWVHRVSSAAHRTMEPDAPRTPGEWCRSTSCPFRDRCPELNAHVESTITDALPVPPAAHHPTAPLPDVITAPAGEPGGLPGGITNVLPVTTPDSDLIQALTQTPDQMGIEQLTKVLNAEALIKDWLKAVHAHAHKLMMNGHPFPEHKLVHGRRSQEWTLGEDELRKKFSQWNRIGADGKSAGKLKQEHYLNVKVVSPNQAKTTIKPMVTEKTWKNIEALIEWKEGALVIAPMTDSREAANPPSSAEVFGTQPAPPVTVDMPASVPQTPPPGDLSFLD